MRVMQVTDLTLQSKLFLRTWRYGATFAVRHYLPDYLPLCRAPFPIRSLVRSHKDLKWGFLKIRHCQAKASIKNWLLHNCSLFTTACPSKIRQMYLEKLAINSAQ